MISDTLWAASVQIRLYLNDPVVSRAYAGAMRERIERLLAEMDSVQQALDKAPAAGADPVEQPPEPPFAPGF